MAPSFDDFGDRSGIPNPTRTERNAILRTITPFEDPSVQLPQPEPTIRGPRSEVPPHRLPTHPEIPCIARLLETGTDVARIEGRRRPTGQPAMNDRVVEG